MTGGEITGGGEGMAGLATAVCDGTAAGGTGIWEKVVFPFDFPFTRYQVAPEAYQALSLFIKVICRSGIRIGL